MNRRFLTLLSLFVSISSFSFGAEPAVQTGGVCVGSPGGGEIFTKENLRKNSTYQIDGISYYYRGVYSDDKNLLIFTRSSDDQLLLKANNQLGSPFLLTHRLHTTERGERVFGPVGQIDRHTSSDNDDYSDNDDDDDESDDDSDDVPRNSGEGSSLWQKGKRCYQRHPWRVKAGLGIAALGTLWGLKKTYCWCFGTKKDAHKKTLLRNRR